MGQTNYSLGHEAERRAAEYLKNMSFELCDINWKNRVCEIDIIAKKNKTIFFVEVKYRTNALQGRGLEYITPKKLQQMRFAAEMWVQANKWKGEYQLAAIELCGEDFEVTNFLTDIF